MDFNIDVEKTAFVVIDLQNGVVGMNTEPYSAEQVVKNTVILADKFRDIGIPIFLVRVKHSPDGKDALKPESDISSSHKGELPEDWSEIVPELKNKGDLIITKKQWGAFYGTDLDLQLRRRGIDTIIMCGIATNIGVESTARFAYEFGYKQIFVEDAMASMSKEGHESSIKFILKRMGVVKSTDEIINIIS